MRSPARTSAWLDERKRCTGAGTLPGRAGGNDGKVECSRVSASIFWNTRKLRSTGANNLAWRETFSALPRNR